eukprot:gnl/MRDRNA2_/MRDRNA2_21889_c0_seq2.p1 gnl/MRDRNA2_/MRDRNA2_21889_c0~~gnl/MRDRNA2_/MRDRNA2_21889_c0_seq2.p1  ORF type:complete len:186 (+),score=57.70 gnl/MRDRNA2_/MRDRNA2_21889_c0_seq2:210-767(+)
MPFTRRIYEGDVIRSVNGVGVVGESLDPMITELRNSMVVDLQVDVHEELHEVSRLRDETEKIMRETLDIPQLMQQSQNGNVSSFQQSFKQAIDRGFSLIQRNTSEVVENAMNEDDTRQGLEAAMKKDPKFKEQMEEIAGNLNKLKILMNNPAAMQRFVQNWGKARSEMAAHLLEEQAIQMERKQQ